MDVNRSCKKTAQGEYECGRFLILRTPDGSYEIWDDENKDLLALRRTLCLAKRWVADHWRDVEHHARNGSRFVPEIEVQTP